MTRPSIEQERREGAEDRNKTSREEFATVRMTFRSGGQRCVGRLYRPDRPSDPALVVLAGGLIGASGFGVDPLAERLAAAGYAVFHFDFRYTGDSDGTPRNLVSPPRQRADWEAALAGLRGRGDVATDRTVLWGVGLAGGGALDVAADDRRVRAVVSQTPILSGREFFRSRGLGVLVGGVLAGVRDRIQSSVGGAYTVPVVDTEGRGGRFALVSTPSAARGYRDLVGDAAAWDNRTPARSLLALARHTAADDRDDVACPVLFVGGTRDDIVDIESIEAAADPIADATVVRLPTGHFGLYDGTGFEQTVGHGLAFLDAVVER